MTRIPHQADHEHCRESGRVSQLGSIVNCASVNSFQSFPGTVAYTASKHACHGITKAAALEARNHNIRVNAVSPGFLLTDMVKKPVVEGGGAVSRKLWSQFEDRQGRTAAFEEVGDVVVLLSTPRMSLVNGVNLPIDNGFTINEGFT
jgi:NAD(P)-dependent dehydrogenase (short-subunit alcohol dehydrogenase family)